MRMTVVSALAYVYLPSPIDKCFCHNQVCRMSPSTIISKARASDSHAIASLFALSWTSPFVRLQFGHMDPHALAVAMTPRIAQQMTEPNVLFMVARELHTELVVSVTQWRVPAAASQTIFEESPGESEERQVFEDEAFYNSLPENSNRKIIMEFTIGLKSLKEGVLQGRSHFLLENVATHADYRRKGLASHLIEYVLRQADEQILPV
ncbi:hypothetical protein BDW02DRAFT_22400 [Decorospora gaudefroyi]|uniref:N-acetyltransferase domain-containing protein n=1 Tax=Decorospora gaudefroyi TaxID=184978 RepID=A0A6A5K7P8_9PLEO|nr:hypothetical protein BDW02DRAFT_22400 [Decorospora gaudefroyi]